MNPEPAAKSIFATEGKLSSESAVEVQGRQLD